MRGVPLSDDTEHGAGGIFRGLAVVEFSIEGVAVGGIGNHGAAVFGGALGEKEIGAGLGDGAGEHRCTKQPCDKDTVEFHRCYCFFDFVFPDNYEVQKYTIFLIW